jgi:hypothetical protein
MNNDFFNILGDILTKKSGGTLHEEPGFKNSMSAYMVARYLSMRDDLIIYARLINQYQVTLTPEQIYKWAYKNVPKQRSPFIKYIKKAK